MISSLCRLSLGLLVALLVCFAPRAWSEAAAANPPADGKPCPVCKGTSKCPNKDCIEGKILCPATCLKKEVGKWEHIHVDGHSDDELWQKFPGHMWTQYHIGQLILIENGTAVNYGKCPTCGGSTRVPCSVCGGDGLCPACHGAKVLSKDERAAWDKQAKIENAAHTSYEIVRAAEVAAGLTKDKLIEVAKAYFAVAQKYTSAKVGPLAKQDHERVNAVIEHPPEKPPSK